MKPNRALLKKELLTLRSICIEDQKDLVLARVAYAIETAVWYATEHTESWPTLRSQAIDAADLIRAEITAEGREG